MNKNTQETLEEITGSRAPRDLEWERFVRLWKDIADVGQESGDRLVVHLAGHRVVFHRQHDGLVAIEDIELARRLLRDQRDLHGVRDLLVVTIDDREARIFDFDLRTQRTENTERDMRDLDRRGGHLRTVERHSGREDEQMLHEFFDEVANALTPYVRDHRFVVFGHGHGKASAAAYFVDRLRAKHGPVARQLAGVGNLDLSAASDTDIERAAVELVHGRPGA